MTPQDDRAVPSRSGRRARRTTRTRRLTAVLVALAVAAVLAPVGWLLGRPAEDAGLSLSEALAAPSAEPAPSAVAAEPSPAPSSPDADDAGDTADAAPSQGAVPGDVAVRDASLGALPRPGPPPVTVRVPALGIDAAIEAVGVQEDGAMVVPAEVDRVGWYRYGPEAGAAEGNVVLAGHVDTIAQGPGALFPLRGVEIGAEIVVADAGGTEHRYEVVSLETITKTDLPVEQIFARSGEHRLVVITCGGEYLPGSRRYADNVVVTAVPVVTP